MGLLNSKVATREEGEEDTQPSNYFYNGLMFAINK